MVVVVVAARDGAVCDDAADVGVGLGADVWDSDVAVPLGVADSETAELVAGCVAEIEVVVPGSGPPAAVPELEQPATIPTIPTTATLNATTCARFNVPAPERESCPATIPPHRLSAVIGHTKAVGNQITGEVPSGDRDPLRAH